MFPPFLEFSFELSVLFYLSPVPCLKMSSNEGCKELHVSTLTPQPLPAAVESIFFLFLCGKKPPFCHILHLATLCLMSKPLPWFSSLGPQRIKRSALRDFLKQTNPPVSFKCLAFKLKTRTFMIISSILNYFKVYFESLRRKCYLAFR